MQFTGTPQCGPPAHTGFRKVHTCTLKPQIKNTPKEDKPPNKGQAESTHVYTLCRKSPLKEDNLSTKYKRLVPKVSLLRGSTVITLLKTTCIKRPLCDVPKMSTMYFDLYSFQRPPPYKGSGPSVVAATV